MQAQIDGAWFELNAIAAHRDELFAQRAEPAPSTSVTVAATLLAVGVAMSIAKLVRRFRSKTATARIEA